MDNLSDYKVIWGRDVPEHLRNDDRWPGLYDTGENFFYHDCSVIVRTENGQVVEIIEMDGGEPEDQTFGRDLRWIAPALKEAYLRGRNDALRARSEGEGE